MYSSYSPVRSEKKAIHFPSGDQCGVSSREALELVRFLTSPFLAGTVKTSPRAPNNARAPDGESENELMNRSTLTKDGRVSVISLSTTVGTNVVFSDLRSRV